MNAGRPIDPNTVAAAVAGDTKALDDLVRTLSPMLYAVARRMMANPADAEEATQEALLRVVTRLSQYRGEAKVTTWAWRVAVRAFLDFKNARYNREVLAVSEFQADLAAGLDLAAQESADDALSLQQLKVGCGVALLGVLDGEHRLAYILLEILEFSSDEVAAILEEDAATLRKRLSRARDKVRAALSSSCGIVASENPCLCHRRLERARALGRVDRSSRACTTMAVNDVRSYVEKIDAIERAAAFYRVDSVPPPPGLEQSILVAIRSAELRR